MQTVAVIAEYNPFHTGHAYHLAKIREEFGADAAVVAIMSGNFVQRGDAAIADKWTRAKAAVLGGCDLALELPFPFSMMSAERFANAGVSLANALGAIDVLSFGSESGDLSLLQAAADFLSTENFSAETEKKIAENGTLGYPFARAAAFREKFPTFGDLLDSPNNNLAISYLSALKKCRSDILPHTVKRVGTPFSSDRISDAEYPSATALRRLSMKENTDIFPFLPKNCRDIYAESKDKGDFPCNIERLASAILSHFRLSPPEEPKNICDLSDGLYTRLRNASFEATDLSTFLSLVKTKHLTDAHLRRAILSSFFGVTSSEANEAPAYTQLLAAGKRGPTLLRTFAETSTVPILTKPSATDCLPEPAKRQKELSDRADSVFELTKPNGGIGKASLKTTPYIG